MDMEQGMGKKEHPVGSCNNNDDTQVAKGKRTKRLRPLSPCAAAATGVTSSCSSASGGGDYGSFSSTTTTFEGTDQEEEDMANCLILLAGGRDDVRGGNNNKMTSATSIPTATVTATINNGGLYMYECKTCNRTFPSFQALGGHRASHKKPKMSQEEKKSPPPPTPPPPSALMSSAPPLIANYEFEEAKRPQIIKTSSQISLQLGCGNNRAFHGSKSKIHECSICGSEFTSGQALGGHMRRHRASTTTTTATQVVAVMSGIETSSDAAAAAAAEVKPRNVLELDLNLPAPEDDVRDSKFQFTATQKSMVLSAAPALVGCHY